VQVIDTSTPILQQLASKEEQFQLRFLVQGFLGRTNAQALALQYLALLF
jgi:hypothetical protein